MAYDFQKLADVELLEEVPDGASALVAVDGVVKRVPGSGLGGGGGVATAILRYSSENNASTKAVTRVAIQQPVKLPITCDNYTYAQARAVLEAGDPFAMIIYTRGRAGESSWTGSLKVSLFDNYITAVFLADSGDFTLRWSSDGFVDEDQVPEA